MKKILLIILLLLSGCARFAHVVYFEPEAQKNINIRSGNRGPKEIVTFQLSKNVESNLILFETNEGTLLRYYFSLPSGETLRFVDKQFIIKDARTGIEFSAPIKRIRGNYISAGVGSFKYSNAKETLIGESVPITTPIGKKILAPRPFELDIKLDKSLPEEFDLYIPQIIINDKKIKFDPITYKKKSGRFWQVIHL
jgi:hypothetical protein